MIYLYDIYIYILYNNTYDFKNTHLLPQHFCKNVANMEYICMFNIYIYTILYLSSNYLCTSQGLLPQLAFSKPVVSLGGVFPCRNSLGWLPQLTFSKPVVSLNGVIPCRKSLGWLPQLTFSKPVVSLGGVVPCRKLFSRWGKVAPASVCCSNVLSQWFPLGFPPVPSLHLQQYHPPRPLCTSPIFQYTSHIAQKYKNFFKMTDNSKKDSLWQQHPVTAPRCAAFYLVSPWLQKSIFPMCLQQFSKYLGQILCGRRADLAAARQQLP